MADLLIRHVDVITLDRESHILENVDVAIRGATILAVGDVPVGFGPDETTDGRDHILMPGLYNAHVHSAMIWRRGRGEDPRSEGRRDSRRWAVEVGISPEDAYWSAALAAAGMIHGGTIGFADQSYFMDDVAQLVDESGLRASLSWMAFGYEDGEVGTDLQGIADFVKRWQGAGEGRINTMLGPYSASICSPQFLARTAAVAVRLGAGIHIHVAESRAQVAGSLAEHDLTPVEVLSRNGILDVPTVAAHAVFLTESDREILAAKRAMIVECPVTQVRLRMGVTPVQQLMADGVEVAIGTEGPPGNDSLSMWQEARASALVHALQSEEPGAMDGVAVLRRVCQAGARALGFPLSGTIAPGHSADLIMIEGKILHLQPHHDLVAAVVNNCQDADVSDVMVAGRWLMRRRKLLTLDEERILDEVRQRGLRLQASETALSHVSEEGSPHLP